MIFSISDLRRMDFFRSFLRFLAALWVPCFGGWVAHGHMIGDPSHDGAGMTTASVIQPASVTAPAGNGSLLTASFSPFKPKVCISWDTNYFYVESDGFPDRVIMPDLMVGITSWQQQIPLPVSYFAGTTNPEKTTGSLGYNQMNVWKLPLVPVPAASPIPLSTNNFQRGAVALAVNGIPIFNPRNNRGEYSYAIGELDQYGGHCGLADDYHYHIAPLHLQAIVGSNQPVAWALDGYPIYGYAEPDGTAQQPLDADGGHTNVTGSYHYHAIGSAATGPQSPYLMNAIHGTVVNFGGQIDGQPEVGSIRPSGTGGYNAKPVAGAVITAFKNPVALKTNITGDFLEDLAGVPSSDQYLMRYTLGGTNYDCCWRINRSANPKTVTVTWRAQGTNSSGQLTGAVLTTTTNYSNVNNRLTTYPMAASSLLKLPDTGQTNAMSLTFGQDADYAIYPPSFNDNGDGTVTDRVTGLMWQKTDHGECSWEAAVSNAPSVNTGGHTDWRLPTPAELFSILNHKTNPAVNPLYFPNNPAGMAEYWWTTDIYGTNSSLVWCANKGGGLGPKPKNETLSAGGTNRYHARYVRGGQPSNGHNYRNNGDGTVTDLDTGLMWQQVPSAATTWGGAITNAENLVLGGYSDWRLPNIKELQTLTDYTLATATSSAGAKACLHRFVFSTNSVAATAYWSSTPQSPTTGNQAWLLELGVNTTSTPPRNYQGIISYESTSATHPSFAVRGPEQIFAAGAAPLSVNGVEVSWNAVPGHSYTIYHSPSLTSAAWTYLGTVRCNWTTGYFTDPDSAHASGPTGFYKITYVP